MSRKGNRNTAERPAKGNFGDQSNDGVDRLTSRQDPHMSITSINNNTFSVQPTRKKGDSVQRK